MTFKTFRAWWGMTGSVEDQAARIAAAGYDGIEFWTFRLDSLGLTPERCSTILSEHKLDLILMTVASSPNEIYESVARASDYAPLKIGMHSGRDYMTADEGCDFFDEALRAEQAIGIPVAHETHRGRLFYTPWTTGFYLERFPELRVLADYSHWVAVCERLPSDQQKWVSLASKRTIHIHGRVGYEQGPQVPDPSSSEYETQLHWHEQAWREIITSNPDVTFTPEYGPPPYLHTLPHTGVPVADLWEVCLWQKQRASAMA